jgi:PTH1 family peptidyl-tRNA hydrolase
MSGRPKLVVGLGNPGREYAGTRHNVGFDVAEQFAKRFAGTFRRKIRFAAELAEVNLDGAKVFVAKPRTFVNRSGAAVGALLNWLKLAPPEMLVVVDDADLPLGQLRLRSAGGSGGHNGLRSIIETLGGNETFPRLRVGISRSRRIGEDITEHVLGKFSTEERHAAQQAISQAADAVECCCREGLAAAMNRFNRKKEGTV